MLRYVQHSGMTLRLRGEKERETVGQPLREHSSGQDMILYVQNVQCSWLLEARSLCRNWGEKELVQRL
jgi:hypothetical protein